MARAKSFSRPKDTQRRQSGRKSSRQQRLMNVANASFSQIPFHHFIVTRSPNHMWAISCSMTSAMRDSSDTEAVAGSQSRSVSRNVTQPRFSMAPWAKSGTSTRSSFDAGYGRSKYVREPSERMHGHLEGEGGEVLLADRGDDADRDTAGVLRSARLQGTRHEAHEIGRHRDGVLEHHTLATGLRRRHGQLGPVRDDEEMLLDVEVTEKTAFMSGSSKQGKARLASVDSKCVVASQCSAPSGSVNRLR